MKPNSQNPPIKLSEEKLRIWKEFFDNHQDEDILKVRDWAKMLFSCSDEEFNYALSLYRFV